MMSLLYHYTKLFMKFLDDFFDKACINTAGQALHAICNRDILLENTHRVYVVHNEYYDCK